MAVPSAADPDVNGLEIGLGGCSLLGLAGTRLGWMGRPCLGSGTALLLGDSGRLLFTVCVSRGEEYEPSEMCTVMKLSSS